MDLENPRKPVANGSDPCPTKALAAKSWTGSRRRGTRVSMFPKYDALKAKTLKLISEGKLPSTPSREQRIDIAYGNAAIENDAVTREMVAEAVDAKRR